MVVVAKKRMFSIDRETANSQVNLVVEAYETLITSRPKIEAIGNQQTAAVWTSDGKSVDLSAMLRSKYGSAAAWINAIHEELCIAAENLTRAIIETDQLDERQRQDFLKKLDKIPAPVAVEG